MEIREKKEKEGKFVEIVFSVTERGSYTDFCIGSPEFILLCIGTKQGFPNIIAGEDHLKNFIKPQLNEIDKRIDPKILAERLIKKYGNKPPKTGIYHYKYYL